MGRLGGSDRVVRSGELTPTPWPNGRGVTRDIVRRTRPDGGIGWLLSIADLGEDAPFSHFPGIDRVFTLIEGGPVELTVDGTGPMRCGLLVPVHFPGDRPTRSRMLGVPARAFNVFVDRATLAARVAVQAVAAGHAVRIAAGAALFCVAGRIEVAGALLDAGDTLVEASAHESRPRHGPAVVLVLEFQERDAAFG